MTRLLVTGGGGQLGTDLVAAARAAGHEVRSFSRTGELAGDVTDAEAVRRAMAAAAPEVVVHAAAWTAVDDCEADPERALAINGGGTAHVVAAAREVGAHVAYVSTDYVFDGTKAEPYREDDAPAPTSAYGRSKLAGERALDPSDATVRISWVCGAHGANMVKTILRLAAGDGILRFVDDQVGHPTFTADLAPALLELALAREPGTWHLTNQGAVSWYGFAREVLAAAGHDPDRVHPIATAELDPPRPAPRPANSVLANARWEATGRAPLDDFRIPLRRLVAELTGGAQAPNASRSAR